MPDREQLVLEVDERPAVAAVGRANAAIEGHEKTSKTVMDNAGRQWQVYGDTVVRVSDRSKTSIDRLVKSMEQQAAVYGKTGTDRLIAQRDQLITKWGQEERAVKAITAAYDKMIAAEHGSGESKWKDFGEKARGYIEAPLSAIKSALGGVLESAGPFGMAIAGATAVVGSFAAAGLEAARSLGEWGVQQKDIEMRTGLAAKEVGQFVFAAKAVGKEADTVEGLMRGLTLAIEDQSGKGAAGHKWLEQWGVDIRGVKDGSVATSDVLRQLGRGLEELYNGPDPFAAKKASMDLFKRAGVEYLPFLLELNHNLEIAQEKGIGASQADIDRNAKLLTDVVLIEGKWAKLKRQMQEGVVMEVKIIGAGFGWLMKHVGGGESVPSESDSSARGRLFNDIDNANRARGKWGNVKLTGVADLERQRMQALEDLNPAVAWTGAMSLRDKARLEQARNLAAQIAKIQDGPRVEAEARKAAEKRDADDAVRAYEARMMRDPEYRLKKAEAELSGMAKPQVGSSTLKEVQDYAAAEKSVRDLKAQIEATKKSAQELKEFQRSAGEYAKRGDEAGMDEVSKIYYMRDQLLTQAQKLKHVEAERAAIMQSADAQAGAALKKSLDEFEKNDQKTQEARRKSVLGMMLPSEAQLRDWSKGFRTQGKMQDIEFDGRKFEIDQRAEKAQKLIGLSGATGVDAVAATYRLRLQLAGELLVLERERVARMTDADEKAIAGAQMEKGLRETLYKAQEEAQMRLLEIQKQQMDELKKETSSLWSTLLTRPGDFGRELAGTLKAAVVKPIADGLGNMTANALKPLIYGADGQGGIAGMFRGMFGGSKIDPMKAATDRNSAITSQNSMAVAALTAVMAASSGMAVPAMAAPSIGGISLPSIAGPAIAGGGAGPGYGGGGVSLGSILGGGGGAGATTPPFLPGGSGGSSGGWGGLFSGLKGMKLGGLIRGPSRWSMDENGDLTKLSNGKIKGVGGAAGAALDAGGMFLAQRGLLGADRGTWRGVGEGAIGGAAVGLQMGGPLGALIGGAAGLLAGIGEKIFGVETPEREAKRLVKQIYGLSIDDAAARQIAALARQSYGGSVGTAVRSAEARQLLQLVAQSTGQKSNLWLNDPHGVSLTESGGLLRQSAVYNNGTPYTYASNLPVQGPAGATIPTGNPYGAGGMQVTLMLNGQSAADVLEGRAGSAIAGNPRLVASSAVAGGRASSARLNGAAMTLSPDTLVS